MAQTPSKWSLRWDKVWSVVKDVFSFEYREKICLQCHCYVSDSSQKFCSQACCMRYWREFQDYCYRTSGKKMCSLPGCSKACYVEHGRIHDYCGRTHATEHAAMMDAVFSSKKSKSKGNGSKTKGHQSQSHSQFTSQTHHGGYFTTSASSPSYWFAKHDTRRGPIHFYNRDDPYYEFTNFYAASIRLDGKDWPTSEHYFQAQKFTGTPYVEQIRLLARPRQAFDLSRDPSVSRWRRSDWEDTKLHVMYKALLAKFTQHDELRTLLLLTGERDLIEHTPYDSFWGDGGNGTGLNHLGKMLMQIRSRFQGKKPSTAEKQHSISPLPRSSFPTTDQPCVVEQLRQSSLGEEHCNHYENPAGSDQSAFSSHSGPATLNSPRPEQQSNSDDSMEDAPSFYNHKEVPFSPTSQQPPYSPTTYQPPCSLSHPPCSSSQHLTQGIHTSTQGLADPVPTTTTYTVPSTGQFQQSSSMQSPMEPNDLTTPGSSQFIARPTTTAYPLGSQQNQPSQPAPRWVVQPSSTNSQTKVAAASSDQPDLIKW